MNSIYWLRNDFRLEDHRALSAFAAESSSGLILWCASPSFLRAKRFRRSTVLSALDHYFKTLRGLGFQVVATLEPAKRMIPRLVREHSVDTIYSTDDPGFEEQKETKKIQEQLSGTAWRTFSDSNLFDWNGLPFEISNTPSTFSAFRKLVEASQLPWASVPVPNQVPKPLVPNLGQDSWIFDPQTEIVPSDLHPRVQLHEAHAREWLQTYISDRRLMDQYAETRNGLLEWDDSSKLSPALSVGSVSAAKIARAILEDEKQQGITKSSRAFYYEILWREYFRLVLVQKGASIFRSARYRDGSQEDFEKWCRAETSCDFVNAHMNEFLSTGWMSNRGRQNVASYLAKSLRVDWRLGAEFFEQHLIDYDCASNYGNWTYLAGVGNDPRDRVFSTQRQAELYDPDRAYRNRWTKKRNDSPPEL